MEEWKEYKLKDVTTILGDGLHGTPKYDENGTVFFINGNNLVNGKIEIKDSTKRVSENEAIKYKKNLNSRTILVSINGTIGNAAKYRGEACILGKSACYFNVSENFDLNFIYYVVASQQFKNAITQLATGTTIKNVSLETMRNYSFFAPNIEEQKRISSFLSFLDDKIELNRRINANLEAQAQALFRSWFVDFEPFRDGPFVDSELGKIPQGWKVGNYTDIVEIKGGGTPKTGIQEYWDGTIPFFSPKDVGASCFVLDTEKHITAKGLENCNSSLFQTNTVFITARGTVGKVVMTGTEMAMNQTNYALLGKQNISQYYVYHITRQLVTRLLKKANGAVFNAITTRDFTSEQIVMPPFSTIRQFSDVVKPIYENILLNDVQSNRLSALRDTLLPKLMSGEIKIRETY